MRDIFTLFLYAIVTIIRLGKPSGLRRVVGGSVLMRHQLLILNRGRKRAPDLRSSDRIVADLCTLLMRPIRVLRSAIVLKPATLLNFHQMLVQQKYRLLFSPKRVRKLGPKGPTKELIDAVVEMQRRHQTWGYQRIAQQIAFAFGVAIDKDVVRRILTIHFHPEAGSGGPSWLSFMGHAKDSLWSLDLSMANSKSPLKKRLAGHALCNIVTPRYSTSLSANSVIRHGQLSSRVVITKLYATLDPCLRSGLKIEHQCRRGLWLSSNRPLHDASTHGLFPFSL